jgi:HPt (histidine-containing phosphotransfer) domain-containing protein
VSAGVADCHTARIAALVEAMGPVRLAGLVEHFRADLAELVAAAATLDDAAFRQWAHRLHGSGSTLGFDAAAEALALAAGLTGGSRRQDAQAALGAAETALARGMQQMALAVPGFAAGSTAAQEADTSKR